MKRIGWTATLTTFVLVLAGCRPTGLEPSRSVPSSQPAVEAPASQPDKPEASARRPWSYTPKTSEGRVLGAIGEAVLSSVGGDTEQQPEEAPRFGP